MSKSFLSIDEQIELLLNRGLKIEDTTFAFEFLLRKNYYNSANVYGKYLQNPFNSNIFVPGASFYEITSLYYFEKNVRDIMFSNIINVEANIKSTISHLFSGHFSDCHAYLKKESYELSYKNAESDLNYLLSSINKIIDKNYNIDSPADNSIDHHLRNYGELPLWVLINYLSFGQVCYFYKLLPKDLKEKIAKSFSFMLRKSYDKMINFSSDYFEEYIFAIKDLRNAIAHDVSLPSFRLSKNLSLHPLNRGEYTSPESPKFKFFDIFLVTRFFMSKDSFLRAVEDVLNEISILEERIKSISLSRFMNDLGFNFYIDI